MLRIIIIDLNYDHYNQILIHYIRRYKKLSTINKLSAMHVIEICIDTFIVLNLLS